MNLFQKKKPAVVVAPVEPVIVQVSLDVMNAKFGREAGRWCEHCAQNGSHHTDTHNDFATAALQSA